MKQFFFPPSKIQEEKNDLFRGITLTKKTPIVMYSDLLSLRLQTRIRKIFLTDAE